MTVPGAVPFRRALLVANPIAGRGRGRAAAEELRAGLVGLGLECDLEFTAARGDAPRFVAERDPATDLVLAVGGDGTVGEVLPALAPDLPLAVLPMGTANVLSLDLRLPRRVEQTLALLRAPRFVELDLSDVDGRPSFLVTGIGFDGAAVRDVEARRSGPIRKWTYVRAVLGCLLDYRAPELTVELDGEALPGTYGWVLVSNMIGYGGIMTLSRERVLDDGLYEVFLFRSGSLLSLVGYALRGVFGSLPGPDGTMLRASRVRIDAPEPVPYQVDGDFGGTTPVEITVTGERRRLLVPPGLAGARPLSPEDPQHP